MNVIYLSPALRFTEGSFLMASTTDEVAQDFPLLHLRVYKDGRVERLRETETVPPTINSQTGVRSKDVVFSPETGVSARIYLPKISDPDWKLPLIVYFHGGAFCVDSAFSPVYHDYAESLAAEANAVVASVEYRRAPEYPLPTAYDDSWAAIKWAASHSTGSGPDSWLNNYTSFDRVFFAGDSAGGNIAHHMGVRVGLEGLPGARLVGLALIHPFFLGKEPVASEADDPDLKAFLDSAWVLACPSTSGSDDPMINPLMDPNLAKMGCEKVLVCVAGKELLRDRIRRYYEELRKSGWGGTAGIMESAGEGHVFHLYNPTSENAVALLKRVASFVSPEKMIPGTKCFPLR